MNKPDNSHPDNELEPTANQLPPAESVALDAWLDEILAHKTPPELTDSILERWHNEPTLNVDRASKPTTSPSSRNGKTSQGRWLVAAIAIAASLLLMFASWQFRPGNGAGRPGSGGNSTVKGDGLIASKPSELLSPPTVPDETPSELNVPKRKQKGVVLRLRSIDDGDGMTDPRSREAETMLQADRGGPLPKLSLVSKQIENHLRDYWNAADTPPTPEAAMEETAARLSIRLGVEVPGESLASPDTVQEWLRENDVAQAIARAWLSNVTSRHFDQLGKESQQLLLREVSQRVAESEPLDDLIANWVGGDDAISQTFMTALGPSGTSPTHPARIANLASLTLSVDLQCTRCHDSLVDTQPSQQEYWNFAAVFAADNPNGQPLFFELPDRRQRAAIPMLAERWTKNPTEPTQDQIVRSRSEFASVLRGSPALARGIVNSLWKIVHGRPLRGHVSHPMSAPMTAELAQIEQDLVDDLVRSDFDIRRTLATILTSPTTRRSVPESVRDVWAADASDAHQKAIVFAGSLPSEKPLGRAAKLDQTLRAVGAKLEASDRELLAQWGGESTSPSVGGSSASLAWDFPDRADGPPVQWLASIESLQGRIEHLSYLAGHTGVPAMISRSVDAMQNAELDEATLLHRVWWLLQ